MTTGSTVQETPQRFPLVAIGVGVIVTLILFAVGGWSIFGLYRGFAKVAEVELRLQRLAGEIVHLDEVLTMSARMAAASGKREWQTRYDRFVPKLDAAIAETHKLAADALDAEAAGKTDQANLALIALEEKAFEEVQQDRPAEAMAILFSPEYEAQKKIYADGMTTMTTSIQRRIDESMAGYSRQAKIAVAVSIPAFVALALGWLSVLALIRQHMMWRRKAEEELVESRRQIAATERELEIASRIQTSILPREMVVEGLDMTARMVPATEVGGDYYDVLPVAGGCWIGIGDVTGHGLNAGLIMLMVQSALAGLIRQNPNGAPREIVRLLNQILYENIRKRLNVKDHVTFSLLRYYADGRLLFAGAHEEMIVCAADATCRRIETPGTWIGAMADVDRFMVEGSCQLAPGDLLLLYTDGLTESMNAAGEQFGVDRMCEIMTRSRHLPVARIQDELLDEVSRWSAEQVDDRTIVLIRYEPSTVSRTAAPAAIAPEGGPSVWTGN
jgi:serine phosphatase RsbU (regulator of sigma subunit)